MKKLVAMKLRRLANFLDPPSIGAMRVEINCNTDEFRDAVNQALREAIH